MVRLNKIYTRTGDDGTTALVDGARRPKYDLRIESYGTVDEANACIGLGRLGLASGNPQLDSALGDIQNDLFDMGADLATPHGDAAPAVEPLRITGGQVTNIERQIDAFNAMLSPLRSFILPGGAAAAAHLHLARAVTRRAERLIVRLSNEETVNPYCIQYINRLSDFLFVAARIVNNNGKDDVLWVPGQNRTPPG
jgi:cob(I)alamin adenosyltransferase